MPEYILDDWGLPYPAPGDKIASSDENLRYAFRDLAGKTGQSMTAVLGQAEAYADAAADAVNWISGVLPDGTDANTLTEDEHAGLWSIFGSYTYSNLPIASAGYLRVEPSNSGVSQRVSTANGSEVLERDGFKSSGGVVWTNWAYSRSSSYPSGMPLSDMRTHGDFIIQSDLVAKNIPDWPTHITTPRASEVRVRRTSGGLTRQTVSPLYADDLTLTRVTTSISTQPFPFGEWTVVGAGGGNATGEAVGLTNDLLKQDFSRRHGGRIRTGGAAAVALRCDHGLVNFRDKILPLCEAAGIVPALALNSRNWNYAENVGVDQTTVNGWAAAGKVEIWNHSATHTNPANPTRLEEEIVTGLQELRTQLPDADIDGWAVPGVGVPDQYMGMGSIGEVRDIYATDAGRMILSNHAVTTGYIPNTEHRIMDGTIRQGQGHLTLESRTVGQITAAIDEAVTNSTGLQLMIHPSLIDTEGYITSAQIAEVITYLTDRAQATELVLVSPYELMIADAG